MDLVESNDLLALVIPYAFLINVVYGHPLKMNLAL